MTNSIKMSKSISASLSNGLPAKTAGRVSMISMLAISVGMAAAPAQAQDMTAPAMTAPVQAPPVITPQPAPASPATMAPTIAAPPASSPSATQSATTPSASQERADALATKGGFDAQTVAPEALAQIEREQQERKAAAAKAAAASVKTPVKAQGSATNGSAADNGAGSIVAAQEAGATTETAAIPTFGTEGTAATVAAIPTTEPAPEVAASPDAFAGDSDPDWNLLAALAALLGVGSAGAYALGRRRKSKAQANAAVYSSDTVPASLNAAIMPELRRDRVEADIHPTVATEQTAEQSLERKATTKADFTEFVANLPAFEASLGKADRGLTIGQRRVAAAPRPYLAETDLYRSEGYFTTHVDSMPTPQNPFLTRQKRLKRARHLDGKLAEMKASTGKSESRTKIVGKMQVSRPLEPAFI